jgi:hypothetical protein
MDRTLEAQSWRRSFAGGIIALSLSVGGEAISGAVAEPSCPYAEHEQAVAAHQLIERVAPRLGASGLAQRVGRAVLGLVFQNCGG